MNYDDLLIAKDNNGIELFENDNIGPYSGLCIENTITINSNIQTDIERMCVLAEELGHYYTTAGDIRDQTKIENRKQERRARAWGYEKVIPIHRLIEGYLYGVTNRYELSEFLGVTEQYLIDSVNYYHEKYGAFLDYNNYRVYFDPLAICSGYNNK